MAGFRKKSEKLKAREKMCWNKKKYHSLENALGASSFILNTFDSVQYPYICRNCNQIHLSTKKFKNNELFEEEND